MARFSRTFLQGMLNPAMQQPLFDAAKSIGQTPGLMTMMRQEKEKKEKRDKGILSGTFDIQQAAQQGNLTSEMLKSYSEDMRNLDVPVQNILTNITNFQRLNLESQERLRSEQQSVTTRTFIESLGEKYASLYAASGDFNSVYTQYLNDTKQQNIIDIAQNFDLNISEQFASTMSSSDLIKLLENKKEEDGNRKWANWIKANPEINDGNRQEAFKVSLAAFGAEGPKKVAELEATLLNNKAKREGDKSVPVLITQKIDSALYMGPPPQPFTENLPVNSDGTLSQAAKNWLSKHATAAMVQDTGETWPADGEQPLIYRDARNPVNQSGQTNSGVTLGNLAPDLITNLSNLELK